MVRQKLLTTGDVMSKYSEKQRKKWESEMEGKFGGAGHPSMTDGGDESLNGDPRGGFSKPKPMDLDAAHRRPRKIYVSEP